MTKADPTAWSEVPFSELRKIRGICLDIDETFSTHGKLTPEAFEALWNLKKAGYVVIPITGRPAGWCDHIARFWPVDAVVGENGAFTFFMEDGVRKRIDTPAGKKSALLKKKLHALGKKIQKKFKQAQWASDQAYREFDLAIDICEDVPAWPKDQIQALLKFCWDQEAHAKLSSIHVNVWYGDYDKKSGLKHFLKNNPLPQPLQWEELLFIGDSPNDEPLFESFEFSIGVANLKKNLEKLTHQPRWITEKECGLGFCEMSDKMIKAKKFPGI